MILGHISYGFSKVAEANSRFANLSDDLVSVMLKELVAGVNELEKGAIDHHVIPNPTGYLARRIRFALVRWAAKEKHRLSHDRVNSKIKKLAEIKVNTGDPDELTKIKNLAKTKQEQEVVHLLSLGYSPKEIAEALSITKQGVANVCANIRKRCNGTATMARGISGFAQQPAR